MNNHNNKKNMNSNIKKNLSSEFFLNRTLRIIRDGEFLVSSDSEFRGVPPLYPDMNYPQQQSFRRLEKFTSYRYFGSDYSC